MRKSIILAAVLVAAATSCQKEQEPLGNFSIRATREAWADNGTKASINSTSGEFTWSKGDAIGIWNGSSFQKLTTQDDKKASATFSGLVSGTLSDYAVYPSAIGKSVSGSDVTVSLPAEYEWEKGEAAAPMLAAYNTSSLSFKHLGGVVMVTLKNVPATAAKFVLTADKDIWGEYTVTSDGEIQTAGSSDKNEVAFTFSNTAATDMEFYVPVPVGEYIFGIKLLDSEDNELMSMDGESVNSVNRTVLKKMPALTCATISGGGEGTTSTTSIPAGHEGTFYLPDTSADVVVNIDGDCTSVKLVYAAGGAKPANVTINAGEHSVSSLAIELPYSHVNMTGGTYTTVTSNTSLNTLVLDKTVKITDKLEVTAGSVEIAGTVTKVDVLESVDANATIKIEGANAKVGDLTIGQGSAVIAGEVNNVTVASTASETAKIEVTSEGKINGSLTIAKGNTEIAGTVTKVDVLESVGADATVKIEGANAKVGDLTIGHGNAVIAGEVTTVTVASTVPETAKIEVTSDANVENFNVCSPVTIVIPENASVTNLTANSSEAPVIDLQDGVSVNVSDGAAVVESNTTSSEATVKSGEKGLRYAVKNYKTVSLGADIEVSSAIEIDQSRILNLCEYTIKASSGMKADAIIIVRRGGNLEIDSYEGVSGMVTTYGAAGVNAAIKVTDEGGDETEYISTLFIHNGIFEGSIVGEITREIVEGDEEATYIDITIEGGTVKGNICKSGIDDDRINIQKDGGTFE